MFKYQSSAIMITLLPKYCWIYNLIVILMQEHLASYSTSLLMQNIRTAICLQYTIVDIPGSTQGLSFRKQEDVQ